MTELRTSQAESCGRRFASTEWIWVWS